MGMCSKEPTAGYNSRSLCVSVCVCVKRAEVLRIPDGIVATMATVEWKRGKLNDRVQEESG